MNMDLERYVPFPPADVVKDFRALRELPSDPDAPNMEVLLAAAQSETIDLHLKVLQGAKLAPQAIDVEPLASARALFYGSQNTNNGAANGNSNGGALTPDVANDYNDATALINIGATSTEISVLRGDVLVFTRAVPNGGNALTQAIADHLGLAWPDAERLKRDMGDALPPPTTNSTAAVTSNAAEDDWSAFGDPDDTPSNTVQTTPVQTVPVPVSPANPPTSTPANVPNVTAAPAAEEADPFDMDIFNKGPRTDDPQEGHRQKQDDKPPFNFDLSRFNFSEEEAEVDDDIPTHPVEADDNPATPLAQTSTRIGASDTPAAPAAAAPLSNTDAQNPSVLPSLSFPMAGEDEELSSMAPSGQMYGVGSVDDPELPSFPSLPQGLAMPDGLLAPGVESYSDGADDVLPTVADESVVVPATQGGVPVASSTSTTSATPHEGLSPETATPAVITPGAATVTGAPMFDFSTPIVPESGTQAGGGDDFDSAFADMISTPASMPPASIVEGAAATSPMSEPVEAVPGAAPPTATPGSLSSPYAVDPAVTAGTSDFDLDQFAAPTSTDDSFRMEDFGLGVGDEGETTPASVYDILQPRLGELVNEVRRSLEYYASRYPDAGVRRIVLVGGGARMPNMDVLLTQEIGIPAMVHNPLAHVNLQAKGLPNDFVDQNGSAFAVALGLAMRDLVG
jgi:Tfp pilus assembly PilM family ATPase